MQTGACRERPHPQEPGYQKGGARGQLCSLCSAVPSKHGPSFLEPGCKQQEGGAAAPAKGGRGPAGNLPEENKCLHPGALTRTRRRPGVLLIRACRFAEKRSSAGPHQSSSGHLCPAMLLTDSVWGPQHQEARATK